MPRIDFRTEPQRWRHWRLDVEGPVATLMMDVNPNAGLLPDVELKLNSYDLSVDIELADAMTRLRFEHPTVRVVVLRSGKPGVFCAGANIRMLARATHQHKVNFCKFTNETRCAIEEASAEAGQTWIAAVSGACAGGGYEIAMAADRILLIDDRRSTVALPETPLLAVLPGTGGLTRLTDKRRVRRDLADLFCSKEEGIGGRRAVAWRLVDEAIPPSRWEESVAARARSIAEASDRPEQATGIILPTLKREETEASLAYRHVFVTMDRAARRAHVVVRGPASLPEDLAGIHSAGEAFWPLALARELDDALLHLRFNEPELGLLTLASEGAVARVLASDALLETNKADWLVREIRLLWRRTLKRLDLTSRSLIALIEPGSCFAGTLAEILFAADRTVMLSGTREGDNRATAIALSPLNFGAYPMANNLSRLATRFLGEPESVAGAHAAIGRNLDADAAESLGLVTQAFDEVDWDDELRQILEERASFSPDALTAMEANLRFAGPETMETRIFGRLTAWQNWVFQRPSAVGEEGALKRYGTGLKPVYERERV
ncbi:MAG: benzoyl-CoA-dihydrodiol lyase [Rhodospirillales bacterium]|nr:benzoyl-CoA-dihydrodiol lyase [Rhodospirillales bacterium]